MTEASRSDVPGCRDSDVARQPLISIHSDFGSETHGAQRTCKSIQLTNDRQEGNVKSSISTFRSKRMTQFGSQAL